MCDLVLNLVFLFVGAAITFLVSRYYYKRASEDLMKKASKLIKKIDLILRAMEEAGAVEWNKDEQGNIIGIVLKLSGSINIKSDAHGKLTKAPKEQ